MKTIRYAFVSVLALAFLAMAAGPAPAHAQDSPDEVDSRWLAWFGCWEGTDEPAGEDQEEILVCFEPLAGERGGVEIHTWMDGELLAVEEVVADGTPVLAADGGCEGERSARWSEDGARVFIGSDLDCGSDVRRTSRGVMALGGDGREWLEIHAVQAGNQAPSLGVRRFVPASPESVERQGVEPFGADYRLAITTARSQAAAPLDPADVTEAVRVANAHVARAMVAELAQPFDLSAETLRAMADEGVPPEVLDVMVAVSYPERFEIEGGSWQAAEAAPTQVAADDRARGPWPATGRRAYRGYSPWDLHWYTWYGSSWYAPGYRNRNPYWDPYWGPRVVVVEPRVRERRGSVDSDRGYTSSRPSSRPATRRGEPARASGSRPPSTTRSSPPSAGSGSSRAKPQGRTGSSGGGDPRPAKRRGGGGGGGSGG